MSFLAADFLPVGGRQAIQTPFAAFIPAIRPKVSASEWLNPGTVGGSRRRHGCLYVAGCIKAGDDLAGGVVNAGFFVALEPE